MTIERLDERGVTADYCTLGLSMPPAAPSSRADEGARVDDWTASSPPQGSALMQQEDSDVSGDEPCKDWQRLLREYRVLEFGCTIVMYLMALVFALIEVDQRPIPNTQMRLNSTATIWGLDPTASEKKLAEHVPMWALMTFGVGIPVVTNLVINYALPKFQIVRVIPHDTRDFLLSFLQSTSMSTLFTHFTKNMTGRFRPCFYDMCGWDYDVVWDGVTNLCTDAAGEKEGRKSFPSGHSSFAWSSMLVLTLYLLGRSRLNCPNRSQSMLRGGEKTLLLFICSAPVLLATWVAVTRCIDNWHHYADITAGSMIGAASAFIGYNYNYGSVFSWQTAGLPWEVFHQRSMSTHRDAKTSRLATGRPHYGDDSSSEMEKFFSNSGEVVVNLSARGQESFTSGHSSSRPGSTSQLNTSQQPRSNFLG